MIYSRAVRLVTFLLLATVCPVLAVPTFQVYIEGATAGSSGGDHDSWFTNNSSFELVVVGAFGEKTVAPLSEVTLVLSVPQGQQGTFSISGSGGAVLLTQKTSVPGGYYNPNADADIDILTDVVGIDGYSTKAFLPSDNDLHNNHYPFQSSVSDFVIFGLGDFYNVGSVNNYNADVDDGGITLNAGQGQEKRFQVDITGFTGVHFDVYGYETFEGCRSFKSTWDLNPCSHDATFIAKTAVVPAPGAILLCTVGTVCVGWLRRCRKIA